VSYCFVNQKMLLFSSCVISCYQVLPPVVWECKGVTWLNIRDNQLVAIAPEIVRMSNLTHLDVGNNQIQELNPVIGKLEHLT
jgi:Leucine-rich repeat (LRR) protein